MIEANCDRMHLYVLSHCTRGDDGRKVNQRTNATSGGFFIVTVLPEIKQIHDFMKSLKRCKGIGNVDGLCNIDDVHVQTAKEHAMLAYNAHHCDVIENVKCAQDSQSPVLRDSKRDALASDN